MTPPARPLSPLSGLLFACILLPLGCVESSKTTSSIEMQEPRTNGAVMLDEPDPEKLAMMAEALDALELEPEGIRPERAIGPINAGVGEGDQVDEGAGSIALAAQTPERLTLDEAAALAASSGFPAEAVRLISLPKLSGTEIVELADHLALRLSAEHGYVETSSLLLDALPPAPKNVEDCHLIARSAEDGTYILRLGYRRYLSQPPHLWAMGLVIKDDDQLLANGDVDLVEPAVNEMIASLNEMRKGLTTRDLDAKLIQLSYTDATTAVALLRGMGTTAVSNPSELPQAVDFLQLPYVTAVPDPAAADIGLVGEGGAKGGMFGLSLTPGVAGKLSANNVASPMTQLMVMFHPAHPEQFSRVQKLIDEYIDRAARQIFVEGMVLEISESGLRDLGIEWELDQGPVLFRSGSLNADGLTDTLTFETTDADFHRIFTRDFPYIFSLKIRALIRDGKAEVLSRPSVLTLNNRQSTIRVGEDIPIATMQEGTSGYSNRISLTFQYLATGILLNIRPRINEDGSEVSMLIDTVVSARVPGADLEVRSVEGELLASAPTVSTRRVQTYSRIRNNTPFIIGGLVAREMSTSLDKIPLLGDLPLIGALFRAERTVTRKSEVIIVLTPYVLPEDQHIARSLPKDDDAFDSFGHELFRDSYRIRTKDVFDLSFLFENERLPSRIMLI